MSNLNDVVGQANLYNGKNYSFSNDRFCNPNSAIHFNNGSLYVPPGVYFCGDFSLTFWLNIKYNLPDSSFFFSFASSIDYVQLYFFQSIYLTLLYNAKTSFTGYNAWYNLQKNTWFHVAITTKSDTSIVFINGNLITQTNLSFSAACLNRTNNIMGSSYLNMMLDEFKIYQGGLSAAQVLNEYQTSFSNGDFFCLKFIY